jgi:hypothetical protein
MHAVIELPTFLNDCRGISDEERLAIVTAYAVSPQQGELMPGTGGARKCRFAGHCCQASPKDTAPVRDDECRNLRGKRGHE